MTAESRTGVEKWLILCLVMGVMFGPSYCYDNPASMLNGLRKQFGIPEDVGNVTLDELQAVEAFNSNFGLLYSLFALPNIVLTPVCGILVDVFGISLVSLACAGIVTAGQLMFTVGTFYNMWALMLSGRAVFGVGMECLYVAQSALLSFWFDDTRISLALSIFGAGVKAASLTGTLTGPLFAGPVAAFGFGAAVCVGSVACAWLASWLHGKRHGEEQPASSKETVHILKRLRKVWLEMFQMPLGFWTMCVVTCFGFTSVSSLSNVAPAYLAHFNQAHGMEPDTQHSVNIKFASMCATMALVSPLAGRFVDASKQYFLIMFTGMAVAGGVLSSAALDLLSDPLLLLIVSSIGFSVYSAAVWPTVPLLVSPSAHGTAYGLLISFQNLGLSLGAEAVSAMQPPRCGNSYECSLFTLAGFAGIAAVGALVTLAVTRRAALASVESMKMSKSD